MKEDLPPQKIPTYREGGFTASATSASGSSIGDEILSLDVSMHDALGMDVGDCSLIIRLCRFCTAYVRKKGEPPVKRRFYLGNSSFSSGSGITTFSSAMGIMYCVHSRDQTDLSLWLYGG
jgi:hypothetical protein